ERVAAPVGEPRIARDDRLAASTRDDVIVGRAVQGGGIRSSPAGPPPVCGLPTALGRRVQQRQRNHGTGAGTGAECEHGATIEREREPARRGEVLDVRGPARTLFV